MLDLTGLEQLCSMCANVIAMCHRGGVLTPGAAFAETSLLERLQRHGMQFNVIEKCWWMKMDDSFAVFYCSMFWDVSFV